MILSKNSKAKFIEINKDKGTNSRAGLLTINGFTIKTPVLWLGHDFIGPLSPWKEKQIKLPGLLVNAYQILKKPFLTQCIYDKGIHGYLDFNGPIMMDSGGFLFQNHNEMRVCASKIIEIYEKAGVDIGVVLDHPFNPSLPASQNRKRWKRTLKNTEAMISKGGSYAVMPVVHGYSLQTLKIACREVRHIFGESSLIGIGSLVPLIKANYLGNGFRYRRNNGKIGNHLMFIGDGIKLVRDEFPNSFLHVFGVGGITTILSIFSMGADSVDSVSWRLKAAYGAIQLPGISDRFLSPRPDSLKARKVLQRHEANILSQCDCPVCAPFKRLGWQKRYLDSSFEARTIHNSWVFLKEVREFRKSILTGEGSVFLAKKLSRSHRFSYLFNKETKEGIV